MEGVHAVILCTLALLHLQVLTAVGGLKQPRKSGSIRQPLDQQTLPPVVLRPLSTPTSGYRRTTDYNQQTVVKCVLDGMQKNWMLALLQQDGIDVWGMKPDGSIDIRMQKDLFLEIQQLFPGCVTLIEDVEAFVKEAEEQIKVQTSNWFESYHSYPEIKDWYSRLANTYPHIVKYVPSIGKSVEGRDMPAVHIAACTDKKKLYFQCQIHAREWISGATCMYIADYLAQNYGKDQEVTDLLNSLEFIFVPIVNPDGYVYTWTTDRLWRKNRQKGEECDGVDLNRNYNTHWGEDGSSSNECSQTYQGQSVESEPETQNVVNYFRQHGQILGAIDWHSFSQRILRPWGHTNQNSPHEEALLAMSNGMSQAAYDVHHVRYNPSKGIDLYPTSGTASDWFYSKDAAGGNKGYRSAGITIELRDTGKYGFLLPPNQIISTGEEIIPAVLYFAKYLLNNPLHYATE